jgi:hypothetical protein
VLQCSARLSPAVSTRPSPPRSGPPHSSLTRIRQRLGLDLFQHFFETVVDLCQVAVLVWRRELYFAATMRVADLFGDEIAAADEQPVTVDDVLEGIVQLSTRVDAARVPSAGDLPWRLLAERRRDPNRRGPACGRVGGCWCGGVGAPGR